jgi:hypothetical protein
MLIYHLFLSIFFMLCLIENLAKGEKRFVASASLLPFYLVAPSLEFERSIDPKELRRVSLRHQSRITSSSYSASLFKLLIGFISLFKQRKVQFNSFKVAKTTTPNPYPILMYWHLWRASGRISTSIDHN